MPFGDSSEIVIHTSINLEETLTRLVAKHPPGMRIEYEKGGARPPGIANLKYHGTSANLGSDGGVQIHYRSMEDLEDLLRILRANAVYLRKEGPWKVTKHRLGRSMLAELALDQAADLAATDQTTPSPILNELL